jgi:hypothetical protein
MGKVISTFIIAIGWVLIFGAAVSSIALTITAAGARGLSFWEVSMLNKFGTFMLVWNYNPAAYLGIIAALFIGAVAVNITRLAR